MAKKTPQEGGDKITLLSEAFLLEGLGFSSDSVGENERGVAGLETCTLTTVELPPPPSAPPWKRDGDCEEEGDAVASWIADLLFLNPQVNGIRRNKHERCISISTSLTSISLSDQSSVLCFCSIPFFFFWSSHN